MVPSRRASWPVNPKVGTLHYAASALVTAAADSSARLARGPPGPPRLALRRAPGHSPIAGRAGDDLGLGAVGRGVAGVGEAQPGPGVHQGVRGPHGDELPLLGAGPVARIEVHQGAAGRARAADVQALAVDAQRAVRLRRPGLRGGAVASPDVDLRQVGGAVPAVIEALAGDPGYHRPRRRSPFLVLVAVAESQDHLGPVYGGAARILKAQARPGVDQGNRAGAGCRVHHARVGQPPLLVGQPGTRLQLRPGARRGARDAEAQAVDPQRAVLRVRPGLLRRPVAGPDGGLGTGGGAVAGIVQAHPAEDQADRAGRARGRANIPAERGRAGQSLPVAGSHGRGVVARDARRAGDLPGAADADPWWQAGGAEGEGLPGYRVGRRELEVHRVAGHVELGPGIQQRYHRRVELVEVGVSRGVDAADGARA